MKYPLVTFLLLVCLPTAAFAEQEVTTPDGRSILLHDDFTWEYLDVADSLAAPGPGEEPLTDFGDAAEFADEPVLPVVEEVKPLVVANPARLEVVRRKPIEETCRIGLNLTNNLPDNIGSIVPQFEAYTRNDVMFQKVFQAFSNLRPTMQQYKEIQYDGITCDDIAYIKVTGSGRCSIGNLSKFSSTDAECLAHLDVIESDLVRIFKEEPASDAQ